MALTEKQIRFCEEYLVDLNGAQSAIRAGYSEKTARTIASEMLAKLDIQEHISELRNEQSNRTKIDSDWVLKRFKEISDRCMTAEPVMIWDDASKQYVESGVYKFDSSGSNKATEMIGRHIGFYEKDNTQKSDINKAVVINKIVSPDVRDKHKNNTTTG